MSKHECDCGTVYHNLEALYNCQANAHYQPVKARFPVPNTMELIRGRDEAIDVLIRFGQTDGDHHKMWVIDQALRALLGDKYERVIAESCAGEDGPVTYGWDIGVPP